MVTSFGSLLQEIAKILDSDAKIEDIDLVIKKGSKIQNGIKRRICGYIKERQKVLNKMKDCKHAHLF